MKVFSYRNVWELLHNSDRNGIEDEITKIIYSEITALMLEPFPIDASRMLVRAFLPKTVEADSSGYDVNNWEFGSLYKVPSTVG